MNVNLESIREETQKALGESVDLSSLTEELVLEAREKAEEVRANSGQTDGNSVFRDGSVWKWRENCSSTKWLMWGGSLRTERIVNCANGFIHYRIDWW